MSGPGFSDKSGRNKTPIQLLGEANELVQQSEFGAAMSRFREAARDQNFDRDVLAGHFVDLWRQMYGKGVSDMAVYRKPDVIDEAVTNRPEVISEEFGLAAEAWIRLTRAAMAAGLSQVTREGELLAAKEHILTLINSDESLKKIVDILSDSETKRLSDS